MPVKIAVVQQETLAGAVELNRSKALSFARQAIAAGADLILFHEELLVGCVSNPLELAEPVDGPTTQAFQTLLRGTPSQILYGLTERDQGRCYIAATLVGASGVRANYRKAHLWWREGGLRHEPSFYHAGDRLVTFNVAGHKSGVMICYDGDFPEMTRSYANLDCTMLFWLNNRPHRGHAEVRPLAAGNSMIIAASCCCGRSESGRIYRGGSNITDHDGTLLAEIWDDEGIIYASVDPAQVLAARRENPLYRGQRRDLYV